MAEHLIPTPRDDVYWDAEALLKEEKRVFEVCNGCRLCFNLCPSFPFLFERVDSMDTEEEAVAPASASADGAVLGEGHHTAAVRGDVLGQVEALERLTPADHQRVVDLCYQCKLCDPICPYQPPHEFAIDFPRLMLRHKAIQARTHGVTLQDRFLGDPDLVGRVGTLLPAVSNWANTNKLQRRMMETVLGIHRERQLPPFARETFRSWFSRTHASQADPAAVEGRKVVLFYTCTVQWNNPEVGRKAVEVLEHNGVTVFAPELRCCGMPALDGGDVARATSWAEQNLQVLRPYVEAGCDVVCPGPSCTLMLKRDWAEYTGSEVADRVKGRSYDLMEYVFLLRKEGLLKDPPHRVGRIGYHVPCHLKVQKIGYRSRDVLKKVTADPVNLVDKCSCMDGTWGMKAEFYDLSVQWAQQLLDGLRKNDPEVVATDCNIARLQLQQNLGVDVKHPIEVLWEAYFQAPPPQLADAGGV